MTNDAAAASNGPVHAPIAWGNKGLPVVAGGMSLAQVGTRGWTLFSNEIVFPACVLLRGALDHNRATMRDFTRRAGVALAPHGKSTMSPQLFDLQFQDGIWGMTAATPAHVMIYRACGASRILYANQLVDPAGIAYVLDEMERDPAFEFLCLVDGEAGARLLRDAVAARPGARPIDVLIEIGFDGGRCGVRTPAQATALVRAVGDMAPHLRLRGVEAFEGVVSTDEKGAERVRALMAIVEGVAGALAREPGGARPIVSIGGSAFVQLVASEMARWPFDAEYVVRSGCYLTNDHGLYARAQQDAHCRGDIALAAPLRPAIEVWGHVLSRPEPDRVIVGVGKRDVSHDIEPPIPIKWLPRGQTVPLPLSGEATVVGLNDQHVWLRIEADHPVEVGDLLALGCSHPCTTFDKWKYMLVVEDDYRIVDAIETRF